MRATTLWRIYLHLAAFAQLGVLSRILIGRLFSGPCSGNGRWSWSPCVTGSGLLEIGDTLFYDFPANVLGSFLIGLFSTGGNLAALYPHQCATINVLDLPLALVPRGSKLQNHGELHLGLRTGFCGSFTTFSSWLMQVVILIVGRAVPPGTLRGTHWVQAMWAIYLGMAGPLLALAVGQHTAVGAAAMWEGAGRGLRHRQQPKEDGDGSLPAIGNAEAADGTDMPAKPAEQAAGEGAEAGVTSRDAANTSAEPAAEAARAAGALPGLPSPPPPAVVLEVADGGLRPVGASSPSPRPPPDGPPAPSPPLPPLPPQLPPLAAVARDGDLHIDLAVGALLLTLTGVSLAYAYLDRSPPASDQRRFWWFSILLGPPGCFLRWHLSRLNGMRDGWLQVGTFAANLLGCGLVFVFETLLFRLAGSLGELQRMALQGLMVGTAGCLTTVSTYVMEIQKLTLTSPAGAYKYFLASTVVPMGLGLLVYGIPVWLGT